MQRPNPMVLSPEQKKLVADNAKLVPYFLAKNRGFRRYFDSYDDLYQNACFGMCKAAYYWDSSRSVPFCAYALQRMKYELFDSIKGRRSVKTSLARLATGKKFTMLSKMLPSRGADDPASLDFYGDELPFALSNFTDKQKEAAAVYLECGDFKKCGKVIGVHANAVSARVHSGAKVVRSLLKAKEDAFAKGKAK